jgi:hypothetical protein
MPKRSDAAQAADRVARAVFVRVRTDRVARVVSAHSHARAARAMLECLDTITTEDFARGGDKRDRERLRAAVDRSNADAL